ncbi:DUF4381 domain-containing protein [Zhongshania sp. BJYM1]|uniref:DUF4381 domain-containing protein n=1 Tax=Zhongshania aquatica TaxID=2965069 RepID=UPI0022B4FD8E|nr:DUF4381 domain-containing protein [Marortus sp. BJYM1]
MTANVPPTMSPAMNAAAGQTSPLAQLADIHLPPPVANFPWAPGWWVLLGIAVIALLCGVFWYRQHRSKSAFRRAALVELSDIATIESDQLFAQQLNQLLRRVALHSYPKEKIAGLSGDKWMDFLYQNCGEKPIFADASLEALLQAAYQSPTHTLARDGLIAESKTWIRRHRSRHV